MRTTPRVVGRPWSHRSTEHPLYDAWVRGELGEAGTDHPRTLRFELALTDNLTHSPTTLILAVKCFSPHPTLILCLDASSGFRMHPCFGVDETPRSIARGLV